MNLVSRLAKKYFLIACVTLSFSVSAQTPTNPNPVTPNPITPSTTTPDISGTYTCTGNDATDGTAYTVELTLTKTGEVINYKGVEKGIGSNRKNFSGTGMFAKNSNNIFASGFWQDNDPTKAGIIVSQIQPDGSWQSTWAWRDKPGINTEVCKKK